MFERYTERARRALFFARWEVSQRGAAAIETEHILLGVLRERKGLVARLLSAEQIDGIQLEVDERTVRRDFVSSSIELPFSDATRRVLEYAAEEADALGHSYIGTEHLLLGLLREESSLAAAVLRTHGVELTRARSQIVELLQAPTDDRPDAAEFLQEIEQVKRLVERLARLAPDQSGTAPLLDEITFRLDRLSERFRR